jgi:uncharacterized RDD family membrane protein YckC
MMEEKDSIFTDLETGETESSNAQRVFANILDWLIEMVLIISASVLMAKGIIPNLGKGGAYVTYIVIFVIMFSYRLVCLLVFNRTAGMMICRIKYLNNDLQPLSSKQKLIAVFAVRTARIRYYKAG